MASGSSTGERRAAWTRTAWQRHLFHLPNASLTSSQEFLIRSTKRIEKAFRNINDYQSNPSAENLMLKALCAIITLPGLNKSYFWLDNYFSSDNTENIAAMLKELTEFSFNQLNAFKEENPDHLAPKKLVVVWLAAAVASWLQIARYIPIIGKKINEADAVKSILMSERCVDILATYNPAFARQSVEHLGHFGVTLGEVLGFLKENKESLMIAALADVSNPMDTASVITHFRKVLQSVTENCRKMQDHLAETPPSFQVMRSGNQIVRVPKGKMYYYSIELAAWDFQFRRMSFCYVHKIKADKSVAKSDPVHKKWWKVTDLYLNMVRRGIKEANEEASVDWYCVAQLNRQLLTAMLSGVAKTVSAQEIEKVTNEMKAAAEKCKEWAPPEWKRDMDDYCLLVEGKVLPFLKKIDPSPTAEIDVFTPGYLKIFEKISDSYGRKKVCAECGNNPDNLLTCTAVSE
jgi:hypothetical protein